MSSSIIERLQPGRANNLNSVKVDVKFNLYGELISLLNNILETKGKHNSWKKSFFPTQLVNIWLSGLNYFTTFLKIIRMVDIQAIQFKFSGKKIPGIKGTSLQITKYYDLGSLSGDKTGSSLTFRHSFCKLIAYKIHEIKNFRFSKYNSIIILTTNDSIYYLSGLLIKIEESFAEWSTYIRRDGVIISLCK
jgi:hypothetical protein